MLHVDDGTLHELVDNALDATTRVEVEAHLASCGECARRYAEATAMARQVVTLLGALDAPAPRIRVVQPGIASANMARGTMSADGGAKVIPMRARLTVLRRVAIAASVMLVAGVSYQVGKRGDAAPAVVAMDRAESASMRAEPMRAAPSVVDGAADTFVAAPAPSARQRTRGGPRADAEAVASSAGAANEAAAAAAPVVVPPALPRVIAPPQGALAQKSIAPSAPADRDDSRREQNIERRVSTRDAETQSQSATARQAPSQTPTQIATQAAVQAAAPAATQDVSRKATSAESMGRSAAGGGGMQSAPPKVIPLAGYSTVEDASVPAMTRRRYISSSGTALELSIMQSFDNPKRAIASPASTPEFIVTSANGRSTVRWHARGLDYVLQGAVSPDSLVKLATQLKP